MPQFYASIQGDKRQVNRLGTERSGIFGHVRGIASGVRIVGDHVNGRDVFNIYKTCGEGGGPTFWIGRVTTSKDGRCIFVPASGRNRRQ